MLVVIHTAETDCVLGAARNLATYFAGDNAPIASAHYVAGPDEVIQTVQETSTAWAAPPLNDCALHIEHAGRASFSPADWALPGPVAMLTQSATLCADLCTRHNIPSVMINDANLTKLFRGNYTGQGGIIGHADINRVARALNLAESDHWDPGPSFPWMTYLGAVQNAQHNSSQPLGEPDMPLTTVDQTFIEDAVTRAINAAIPTIAVQAAITVWTRYRMTDGTNISDLQTTLSRILAAVPADASRDAAVAVAVAAVPTETVTELEAVLNPPAPPTPPTPPAV